MARKRFIRARDLYRLETVTYAELSPDGKHVVYAVQEVDPETQKKIAHLWIAPTEGGKPYQFVPVKTLTGLPADQHLCTAQQCTADRDFKPLLVCQTAAAGVRLTADAIVFKHLFGHTCFS